MKKIVFLVLFASLLSGCATYTDAMYNPLLDSGKKPETTSEHINFFFNDIVKSIVYDGL